MPAKKFRFVSPGVLLSEIDKSQTPRPPAAIGPVIIGRFRRGPSMRPVKVSDNVEFETIFGSAIAGPEAVTDPWRDGEVNAPTYAAYAARAWLKNGDAPATIVRLAGVEHSDKDANGNAGWTTSNTLGATPITNGGAYALCVWPSSSTGYGAGTVGAIFYANDAVMMLSGVVEAPGARNTFGTHELMITASNCTLFRAEGNHDSGGTWKVMVANTDATLTTAEGPVQCSFTPGNQNFIRTAMGNLSPSRTNSTITTTSKKYWLGETFEYQAKALSGTAMVGAMIPMGNGTLTHENNQKSAAPAKTGWFVAQDTTSLSASYNVENMQKLFRIESLPFGGAWEQNNLSISIEDLSYSTDTDVNAFGTFTVAVRLIEGDSDVAPQVVERFSNCNLNPNSPDYIAKRIGDREIAWSDTDRILRDLGDYDNVSQFVKVTVDEDVANGRTNAELLPFGFLGPPRYKTVTLTTNKAASTDTFLQGGLGTNAGTPQPSRGYASPPGVYLYVTGGADADGTSTGVRLITHVSATLDLRWPSLEDFTLHSASAEAGFMRHTASLGTTKPTNAYFGINTNASRGNSKSHRKAYRDYVRAMPVGVDSHDTDSNTELSFTFSLDDVIVSGSKDARWLSGSRRAKTATSAVSASWKQVLDDGYDKYTAPLFGGTDGVDIKERDPFNNASIGASQLSSYEYNTIKRAIDTVADAEAVEMNALVMPGIDTTGLTDHMVDVCETRGDALAIIDLVGGYTPRAESKTAASSRVGSVKEVIDGASGVRARKINSSYAAAYYPWVQIQDGGSRLMVPPSVVALGTLASSDKATDVWFAPAGFVRGGLTGRGGASGLNVVSVEEKLTAKQRDKLYANNVNPIASFPAEGIVIFGQKTMQLKASALDRINVRRLLIFVKKEVSRIAATTLFENSIAATWNDFSGKVERLLSGIQAGGGLSDYRVVLDETTTTPDLVDRNILYAKVFLKPARSIEFIAVDFVITRSGASFDD